MRWDGRLVGLYYYISWIWQLAYSGGSPPLLDSTTVMLIVVVSTPYTD